MTVYEKIKSMSLEEMADFMKGFTAEDTAEKIHYCARHCPYRVKCDIDSFDWDDCYDIDYKAAMEFYLNQEWEEATHE